MVRPHRYSYRPPNRSTTGTTAAAKVAATGLYELAVQHYIAGICARFGEHRKWIAGNRRFLEVKAEWEKQPFDQHTETITRFLEYWRLQNLALNKPNIRIGEPTKPVLSPVNEQAVVGEFLLTYLQTEDFEKLNKYLWSPLRPNRGGEGSKRADRRCACRSDEGL